jgi:uncharacterized protein (DUF488 family)
VSGPVVLTLGHSARSLDELVLLLRRENVATLIDVRRYPGSKRHPQFSKRVLAGALLFEGVGYFHEPDLGGMRTPHPDSPNDALPDSFRGYADHMASSEFGQALERVVSLARRELVALMCAESSPERCHRRYLADALAFAGFSVRHVLDGEKSVAHAVHPLLRRDASGCLSYRKSGQLSLF